MLCSDEFTEICVGGLIITYILNEETKALKDFGPKNTVVVSGGAGILKITVGLKIHQANDLSSIPSASEQLLGNVFQGLRVSEKHFSLE